MGLVQGFHGLLIARVFLGVTEAGLAPGIVFYLTMWYPRYEVYMHPGMNCGKLTMVVGSNEECHVLQRLLRSWRILRSVGICDFFHGGRW